MDYLKYLHSKDDQVFYEDTVDNKSVQVLTIIWGGEGEGGVFFVFSFSFLLIIIYI